VATNHLSKVIWITEGKGADLQIYLNPAIIDCISKTFFSGPSAFGFKFRSCYVTSLPGTTHTEPEITIPIVALGATAVSKLYLLSSCSLIIEIHTF